MRNQRAPIVPDDHRRLFAEPVHQSHHIARKLKNVVRLQSLRRVRLPVPAQIRRHRMKTRLGQRGKLMTPRIPRLRKSVEQHDQRPRPRLHTMHADAVCFDRPAGICLHMCKYAS